jgi:exonuclease III
MLKTDRERLEQKNYESDCHIICLQETKCEMFDWRFIGTFCPKRFDHFAFSPSVGASGGILVI